MTITNRPIGKYRPLTTAVALLVLTSVSGFGCFFLIKKTVVLSSIPIEGILSLLTLIALLIFLLLQLYSLKNIYFFDDHLEFRKVLIPKKTIKKIYYRDFKSFYFRDSKANTSNRRKLILYYNESDNTIEVHSRLRNFSVIYDSIAKVLKKNEYPEVKSPDKANKLQFKILSFMALIGLIICFLIIYFHVKWKVSPNELITLKDVLKDSVVVTKPGRGDSYIILTFTLKSYPNIHFQAYRFNSKYNDFINEIHTNDSVHVKLKSTDFENIEQPKRTYWDYIFGYNKTKNVAIFEIVAKNKLYFGTDDYNYEIKREMIFYTCLTGFLVVLLLYGAIISYIKYNQ